MSDFKRSVKQTRASTAHPRATLYVKG
jgi:hypothetical protein